MHVFQGQIRLNHYIPLVLERNEPCRRSRKRNYVVYFDYIKTVPKISLGFLTAKLITAILKLLCG